MLGNKFKKLLIVLVSGDFNWYRALLRYGVAPSTEHIAALRPLDVDLFIDVGANRGQFSLAATKLRPKARIICFEPLAAAHWILRQVFVKSSNVEVHKAAIGDLETNQQINVSYKDDSSSLLNISPLQSEIFPGTERKGQEQVVVRRLSGYMAEADLSCNVLLKIDVQGYELRVLAGASNILDRVKYVYVECSFVELYQDQAIASDVIDFLADKGFVLLGAYNLSVDRNKVAVQMDFLFENRHA